MRFAAFPGLISLLAAQDLSTAVSALENGRFEDAARALSEILGRTPDDPDANYYLGMTYFRQGRARDARPFLERATRLSPSKPSAWKALGLALLGANDYSGPGRTPCLANMTKRSSPSEKQCAQPRLRTRPLGAVTQH
jgi:predicted Zn-dependent protease